MKHFLLFYDYVPDYISKRAAYRDAHLKHAWAAQDRGELVLGGALADPSDAGVLMFQGDSAEVAEAFALSDPYVLNGLVTHWRVRQWVTVVGRDAAQPVRG